MSKWGCIPWGNKVIGDFKEQNTSWREIVPLR